MRPSRSWNSRTCSVPTAPSSHCRPCRCCAQRYVDTGLVKFVSYDLPLNFHAYALPAAVAARCAGEQGQYWAYREALYRRAGAAADRSVRRSLRGASGWTSRASTPAAATRQQTGTGASPTPRRRPRKASARRRTFVIGRIVNGQFIGELITGAQPIEVFEAAAAGNVKGSSAASQPLTRPRARRATASARVRARATTARQPAPAGPSAARPARPPGRNTTLASSTARVAITPTTAAVIAASAAWMRGSRVSRSRYGAPRKMKTNDGRNVAHDASAPASSAAPSGVIVPGEFQPGHEAQELQHDDQRARRRLGEREARDGLRGGHPAQVAATRCVVT